MLCAGNDPCGFGESVFAFDCPAPPHPVHLKVVVGDVVVVRLHLTESLLVVPHEVVDVQVLPLFYLMNIHLGFGKRGKKLTDGRLLAFRTPMPETACRVFPGGTT